MKRSPASLLCLLVLSQLLLQVNCAKILVWSPLLGRSHARFMARIADILVQDGHNVTFFQTIFDPDTIPVYDTLAQTVLVHHPTGVEPSLLMGFDYKNEKIFQRKENLLRPNNAHLLMKISSDQCRGLLNDEVTTTLRREKYELLVFELVDLCPGLWLQYIGIDKMIATSSYGTAPIMDTISGVNSLPSYVPWLFSSFTDQMNIVQRMENALYAVTQRVFLFTNSLALHFIGTVVPFPEEELGKQLMDPLEYLETKTGAYFINMNEFTETARPILRNYAYIGGLMVEDDQPPLTGEYAEIYNQCLSGVVVFSFGSMVKTKNVPESIKIELLQSFASFPDLCFLWKADTDDFITDALVNQTLRSPNVFIRRWLPQQQLLADSRTRFFITHAGANSINEAVAFGVPVITVPLYLDNHQNSVGAVSRGMGVTIEKMSLGRETMTDAIRQLMANATSGNNRYAKTARNIAAQLHRQRRRIPEEIVEWTQRIVEFGPMTHLQLRSTRLSFIELYNLDILAILVACFLAIIWGIRTIVRHAINSHIFRQILASQDKVKVS